jgi:exoribonuclease R
VRMDNWPANSQYPNGHFVRSLGQIGDLEAEIKVLLVQHDIDDRIGPFSQGND